MSTTNIKFSWNKYLLFIMCLVFAFSVSAQEKYFNKALRDGRKTGEMYSISIPRGKYVSEYKVRKYAREKGYGIYDLQVQQAKRFGDRAQGVYKLKFYTRKMHREFAGTSTFETKTSSANKKLLDAAKKEFDENPQPEELLTKVLKKADFRKISSEDRAITCYGLAEISEKKGDIHKACSYIEEALTFAPNYAPFVYQMAKYSAYLGAKETAMNLLFKIPAKISAEEKFDNYRKQAAKDKYFFNSLYSDTKFQRYLKGYRRLKVQPYFAKSSESDGWFDNGNELFIVVENQNRIMLSTDVAPEGNKAYWRNDYVIFDYPLTSKLRIALLEEDWVKHDALLKMTGFITKTGNRRWESEKSAMQVKISDTDEPVHTTGTYIPPEISLTDVALAIGVGAALYSILSDSELDHTSNSSSFISCSNSTKNPTDLYILSIGTNVYEDSPAMDNDAREIANKLREGCGNNNLFGNIYSKVLTNSDATKTNILYALNEIKAKTNENDIFLVFFSGHGGFENNKFIFVARNGKVTVDEIVTEIDADNCKTILWFDACRAGQVETDFRDSVDDYIRKKQLPNISILMSSSDFESSFIDKYSNMGFFTKTIIDGLNGSADAGSKNRFISLRELANYVIKIVPQRTSNCNYCTNTQHPRILNEGKSFNTRLSEY